MKKSSLAALILTTLISAACGGGGGGVNAPGTPGDGNDPSLRTIQSPYGMLTPAEALLLGEDKDGNGVRDDFDAWIARLPDGGDARVRELATMKAKIGTFSMIQGARRQQPTKSELGSSDRITLCYYASFRYIPGGTQEHPSAEAWEGKLFNTKARMQAYLRWNAMTSGFPGGAKSGDTCSDIEPPKF